MWQGWGCPQHICATDSAGFLSSRLHASSRKSIEPDWQEVQRAVSHQHLRSTSTNTIDASFPPYDCLGKSRLAGRAGAGWKAAAGGPAAACSGPVAGSQGPSNLV